MSSDVYLYKRLAMAIVEQAVIDYWIATSPNSTPYMKRKMRATYPNAKKECEEFFRSGWFATLMDTDIEPEYFMEKIRSMKNPPKHQFSK